MMHVKITTIAFFTFLLWNAVSFAAELKPADKTDVASGAATTPRIWCPGGIKGYRLAVGQPNKGNRNDKVLFRFSLGSIKAPVVRAELRYRQTANGGNAEVEELIVEHLTDELKELKHSALNEKKTTPAGKYRVRPGERVETVLDVTELVREDIRRGYGSIAFRVASLVAPKGPPKNKRVNCIDIDKGSITLDVTDEKELKEAGVILSPEGKPYQGIEVDPNASELACYAARELQDHLYKILGVRLPIHATGASPKLPVIAVGRHAAKKRAGITLDKVPGEGFRILTTPDALVIAGNDHEGAPLVLKSHLDGTSLDHFTMARAAIPALGFCLFGDAGSLHGVYHFLEQYAGVRWYMPGPDGCVIQKSKKLLVPQIAFADSPRASFRYIFESLLFSDVLQWHRRIRAGGAAPVLNTHSFGLMRKYKDTHPEYFALGQNGKRDFKNLCTKQGRGHLCLTNPETVKAYASEAIAFFRKYPQMKSFPVMPGDGLVAVCSCPKCQAEVTPDIRHGRFSRHVWGFVNKVAREVAKVYPDKILSCSAYEEYLVPPEDLEFEPNVAAWVCYNRYQMINPIYAKEIHRIVDLWAAKVKFVYSRNYYLEWRKMYDGLQPGSPRQYQQDFRRLASKTSWRGEFIETGVSSRIIPFGTRHLLIYISCRLLWNPDTDVDALLNEYYRLFYGPAEKNMKEFFEMSFSAIEQKKVNARDDLPPAPESIYTPALIRKLEAALERARKAAPAGSVYRRRVDGVRDLFLPAAKKLRGVVRQGNPTIIAGRLDSVDMLAKAAPVPFVGKNGETPEHRTWVAAGYDAGQLYLRFYCYEEKMSSLKADYTGPSDGAGLWNDDTVEIFLTPDPADPLLTTYQFAVNPNGRLWDGKLKIGDTISDIWNSKNVKVRVTRQSNRWIVDMSVPFSELGVTPAPGKQMKVNFVRNRVTGGKTKENSCFAPSFISLNFMPQRFGTLILGK